MPALRRPIAILAALTLLAVAPTVAEIFKVQLKNGNVFETRYRPKVADWDAGKVVLLTDVGNRITLLRDDIVEVISDTELKGFGTVIDTTTIVLGWAPNDAPTGGEAVDPTTQWMNYLQQVGGSGPTFSVDQFVNVEDAGAGGGAGGGLPAWEFGPGSSGAFGSQSVIVAPPPAASAPPAEAPTSGGDDQ